MRIVATYVCTRHSSDGECISEVFNYSLEGKDTPAIMCPTCHRLYLLNYENAGQLAFYCDRLLDLHKLVFEP